MPSLLIQHADLLVTMDADRRDRRRRRAGGRQRHRLGGSDCDLDGAP
ncbi:MAG: hypothetical protein R2854_11755 [Caldilineaceae bacterium]